MREVDLTPSYQDALRLDRLREQAKHSGLKLSRSRRHRPYVRNRSGLILLGSHGEVIAGDADSLDLASVEKRLSVMAIQRPSAAANDGTDER